MRVPRTARTPRTANNLFSDLNQPIRNRTRTPVVSDVPVQTPRPRIYSQRSVTDTTGFKSVSENTKSIDVLMSSARRDKAAQIQSWIEYENPKPLEILRKIAEVSPPHNRILTLICDELSKFPPSSLQEPIFDLNDDAADQMAEIHMKARTITRETEDLEREEADLLSQLEAAKKAHSKAQAEHDRMKHLLEISTFNEYEKEQREQRLREQERQGKPSSVDYKDSNRYNELWGENRHLKNEMEKLTAKIDEHRKFHKEFTKRRAEEKAEKAGKKRKVQDVHIE